MIDCGTTGFMGPPTHIPTLVSKIVFYVEIDELNSALVAQCSEPERLGDPGGWGNGVCVWSLLRSELLTRIAAGLFLRLSQLTSAGFYPTTPHF